jgi:hypothetical protein
MDISVALVDADIKLIDEICGMHPKTDSSTSKQLLPNPFANAITSQVTSFFSSTLTRKEVSRTNTSATVGLDSKSADLSGSTNLLPVIKNAKNVFAGFGQKMGTLNIWGIKAAASSSSENLNDQSGNQFLGHQDSSHFVIDDGDDENEDDDYHMVSHEPSNSRKISITRTDQQRAQVYVYSVNFNIFNIRNLSHEIFNM